MGTIYGIIDPEWPSGSGPGSRKRNLGVRKQVLPLFGTVFELRRGAGALS